MVGSFQNGQNKGRNGNGAALAVLGGDNFASLGPIRNPRILRPKWGKQPYGKKLYCFEKSYTAENEEIVSKTAVLCGKPLTIRRCGLKF
jgi:hypothetical protein